MCYNPAVSTLSSLPGPGALVAGRYRIEEALSRGGMGAVFIARHDQTGRRFALKLMSQDLAGDAEAEARFMREARLASSLDHPAIIEVYDVGRHEGFPYMVMRLLEGESLGTRLKRGKVPPHEAVVLLGPVLEGIAAAHGRGIVHRDLKPDNIYLSAEDGSVAPKILDFGISKLIDGSTSQKLTRTGVTMGTPLYMSPEQVRGERDIDGRTDVYSMGVILYQMLTGTLPFQGNTYADLVLKIVSGDAPRLRERDASLPAAFEQIVHCAIATQRDERYPDITSMLVDLRAVDVGKVPSLVPRISRPMDADSPTPFATEATTARIPAHRGPGLALGLGAGAMALAVAAWLLWPASEVTAPDVHAAAQSPVPADAVPPRAPAAAAPAASAPVAPLPAPVAPPPPPTAPTPAPAPDPVATPVPADLPSGISGDAIPDAKAMAPDLTTPARAPATARARPAAAAPTRSRAPTTKPPPAARKPKTVGNTDLIDPFQ
jgi:serine/threonine-protein kinase